MLRIGTEPHGTGEIGNGQLQHQKPVGHESGQWSRITYVAAGNTNYDGGQAFTYDALGKQVSSSWNGLQQSYDGDGLRTKKLMDGVAVYYLRSSLLGGKIVAEISSSGSWNKGFVYLGEQMLAVQSANSVTWAHQEPITKGQRFTNSSGAMTSTVIEVDPFGAETSRTANGAFQPQKSPATHAMLMVWMKPCIAATVQAGHASPRG